MTKATFDFASGLLIGPNLDSVILEGVNALSLNIDGNASFEKSINGSVEFTNGYVSGGTKADGHDASYPDDPNKGFRVGRGNLGGFGGGQGPGKGVSLGSSGAGGLSGGGGSFAGEGGAAASGPAGITYGTGGMEVGLVVRVVDSVHLGCGSRRWCLGDHCLWECRSIRSQDFDEWRSRLVNPTVGANYSGGAVPAVRFGLWRIVSIIKGFLRLRVEMPRVWIHERLEQSFSPIQEVREAAVVLHLSPII